MASLYIGAEYDADSKKRLRIALSKSGAKKVNNRWSLFGSQEIQDYLYKIDGFYFRIVVETYEGISISGDDEAIDKIKPYL